MTCANLYWYDWICSTYRFAGYIPNEAGIEQTLWSFLTRLGEVSLADYTTRVRELTEIWFSEGVSSGAEHWDYEYCWFPRATHNHKGKILYRVALVATDFEQLDIVPTAFPTPGPWKALTPLRPSEHPQDQLYQIAIA